MSRPFPAGAQDWVKLPDGGFAHVQDLVYASLSKRRARRVYNELEPHLPPTADHILDLGCGGGELLMQLASRARFGVGLDLSPFHIENAKRSAAHAGITKVGWLVADAAALPFADGSFELIVSYNVLRLTPIQAVLGELGRIVRSGGRIVLRDQLNPPLQESYWRWHLLRTLRIATRWAREYPPRVTWQMIRYVAGPTGISHARLSMGLTPEKFANVCRAHFPDARICALPPAGLMIWDKKA